MAKNINLEMQLWKTEEEQINAIKATVNSFRFIRNPSKKVQLFVVKKKMVHLLNILRIHQKKFS